ncbi:MAG: ComF family protein [Alphaproteobacteria bacterium]
MITVMRLGDAPLAENRPRFLETVGRWMAANLRYGADLMLPPVCLHCYKPLASHGVLCADCWRGIDFIAPPVCDRLGLPMPFATGELSHSTAAIQNPPAYARARAAARFEGVMRELVHAFKYNDRHEPMALFGRMLRSAAAELAADADVIIPVPLHWRRLWMRRYNQAALLATRLASETGLPLDLTALKRTRYTTSQASLSGAERRENLTTAFVPARGAAQRIRGKRVLLVDDVITTGATMEACTHALKNAGATEVDCVALALAVPHNMMF